MTLNVSKLIEHYTRESNVDQISELLRQIMCGQDGYIFDENSYDLIYRIPQRIPGQEMQLLVDSALLYLFSLKTGQYPLILDWQVKQMIILDILWTRYADVIVMFLDHSNFNNPCLAISKNALYNRICSRSDLDLDQLRIVLNKLWSMNYAPTELQFLTYMKHDKLEYILRCFYDMPGFVTKMTAFIDGIFIAAHTSELLHMICRIGFVPSTECMINILLHKESVDSILIILSYYPCMISIFTTVELILIRLLDFHQFDTRFIEMRMLQKLKAAALDYIFDGLTDYIAIPGTHLKLYGLQYNPILKYFFQYYLTNYTNHRSWKPTYNSPIFARTRYGRTEYDITEVRTSTVCCVVNVLRRHLRNCRGIINQGY